MNIETANRLKQMRTKFGLSQEELASKIGVSRQAVSKWERAEASPDTENLILLAKLYGVTIDELLRAEGIETAGVSLNKEDYPKPPREVYPQNYTEEEIYPGKDSTVNQSVSVPQGSPFGADIGGDERKSSEGIGGIGDKVGRAGLAIGDMLNSAGEVIRKGNAADWDDKLEKNAEKLCKGLEKGMDKMQGGIDKMYDRIEKRVDKASGKYEKYSSPKSPKRSATLLDKIFPIIITMLFLCTCGIGLAHPGWTLFLLIPLYYTGKKALWKRNPLIFCYPVFCAFVYFSIGGFFDVFFGRFSEYWYGFMWLLFLTIPLYYTLFPAIRKRNPLIFCYPVLAVMVYLGFGILLSGAWSNLGELWLATMWAPLGLSIPLYYIVISHYRNKRAASSRAVD